MRRPNLEWDETTTGMVLKGLKAIAEGYNFQVVDDRWIVIDDPDHSLIEPEYLMEKIVIDVHSLHENGDLVTPTEYDLAEMEEE